jgi:hypothetical protein
MAALTGRSLKISVGATDYEAQVFAATVEADDAESDNVTFAEAAAGGGRVYVLKITMTQDMAASTLWSKIWDAAGTDVTVLMKPYGNTSASASQPHFTMTATVSEPNGVLFGGEADASPTNRLQTEVEWKLAARPTRITA